MRRDDLGSLAGGCLVLSLVGSGGAVIAADGPRDDPMAAIVAAVRAEEAKFRDIEYTVRIVVRDASPKDAGRADGFTTLTTRHAIFQGDRTYLRLQVFGRGADTKFRREEVSAYDGERTRTVVAGNSANIHLGRWTHPDICPAHSLPLAVGDFGFPLSVFLGGTEAIHAHPAYARDLDRFGALDAFVEVAPRFESEEVIDGLRCLKIRVERRYSGDARAVHELWLAPERNHHCIKDRLSWPDGRFGHLPAREMRLEGLRELSPGVWFPTRIVVDDYDAQSPGPDRETAAGRTVLTVEKVEFSPRREAAFFRNVPIPADLPVFTVKDRQLVGWAPPRPIDGGLDRAAVARLAARLGEQERRYDGLEVRARERRLDIDTDSLDQNRVAERSSAGRSVHRGDRYFSACKSILNLRSGARRELSRTMGYDGQWTRLVERDAAPDGPSGRVILQRGRSTIDRLYLESDGPHHPHTLVLRDYPRIPTLAQLLDPSWARTDRHWGCCLRDAGTAEVDGHRCLVLAGDLAPEPDGRPGGTLVLYLATDRNDIPIRLEFSNARVGDRYIPSLQATVGDLREIAPGIWYPFRITALGFETGPRMARGWFVLNRRCDTTIESARLRPEVDESVFRDVVATAGAEVQVLDEHSREIGKIRQAEEGVPSFTPPE